MNSKIYILGKEVDRDEVGYTYIAREVKNKKFLYNLSVPICIISLASGLIATFIYKPDLNRRYKFNEIELKYVNNMREQYYGCDTYRECAEGKKLSDKYDLFFDKKIQLLQESDFAEIAEKSLAGIFLISFLVSAGLFSKKIWYLFLKSKKEDATILLYSSIHKNEIEKLSEIVNKGLQDTSKNVIEF